MEFGSALVADLSCSPCSPSPFLLKKFTRKTLINDYRSTSPLPGLLSQLSFSFVVCYFSFCSFCSFPFSFASLDLKRARRGHTCSCPWATAWVLICCLSAALALRECALACSGCQSAPRLKVKRRTGAE